MKVVIAGSRHLTDVKYLDIIQECIKRSKFEITEVVSGGAKGIDQFAIEWAKKTFIPYKVYQPLWDAYGKAAGPLRNRQMADYADGLIAIWDNSSRGTANMIDEMKKLNKPVFVYTKLDIKK